VSLDVGVYFQRGDIEAKNCTVFACPLTGTFQAYLCYLDFNAAELETCQLGPPASAATA